MKIQLRKVFGVTVALSLSTSVAWAENFSRGGGGLIK